MADRKRNRRKNEKEEKQTCTKEEYAVAKFMRFNAPTRDAKFVPVGNYVKCFVASKVVDALMDSKWAKGTTKGDIQFTDRKSVVAFCDRLLSKGLFHRAMKIKSKRKKKEEESAAEEEKKKKKKSKKDTESKKDTDKESKKDEDEESKKDKEKSDEKEDSKKDEDKKKDEEKKKKEKKLRLDMHEDQRFVDGEDIYVWIFDPVPAKTFIIGLLMVVGAAALCLFPLWPGEMRIGVYYISLVGASFVGFILLLVLLRFILFCALWILTLGKLHFWLLPNLTEDVGFIDSFRPLYTYKIYKPSDKDSEQEKKKKSKKEKKEKESDKDETETGDDLDKEEQEFEMVHPEDVDFDDDEEESGEGQTEDGGPIDDDYDEESQNDSENKKDK